MQNKLEYIILSNFKIFIYSLLLNNFSNVTGYYYTNSLIILSKLNTHKFNAYYYIGGRRRWLLTFLINEYLSFNSMFKEILKINVNWAIQLNLYKGTRHFRGLPVRGQRTRTNAKTRRNFIYGGSKI
jgi:ribosomal protein S13